MHALVTGATGFLGQHLTQRLNAMGHTVRALVRSPSAVLDQIGAEVTVGDLTRRETVAPAVSGAEVVFHLAALRDRWGTPQATYQAANVEGTRLLLAEAERAGVQRFVHCSSVGVARHPGRVDADEQLPYTKPTSQVDYHLTKAEAERAALTAGQQGPMSVVVVRPVITYGPGDRTGMMAQLLVRVDKGHFLQIGSGRNHLDVAYISDVINGIVLAATRGVSGRVYIISGPQPITLHELLAEAYRAAGKTGPSRATIPAWLARWMAEGAEQVWGVVGRRPPVTRDAVLTLTVDRGFSHARAAQELGYVPQWQLQEGLRETVAWLRQTGLMGEPAGNVRA